MKTEISIRIDNVELYCKSYPEFINNDLMDIFKRLQSLINSPNQSTIKNSNLNAGKPKKSIIKVSNQDLPENVIDKVIKKLGAKKGPEIILAICHYVASDLKKETITKKDILEHLKQFSGYKTSLQTNIKKSLTSLINSKKITEVGKDNFVINS